MSHIVFHEVDFTYDSFKRTEDVRNVIDGITLSIDIGEFVVLLGTKGSGKSTFLKLCNALLLPGKGVVRIGGIDTRDDARIWEIRKTAGMIFQDPDSQIIGATVAEDVAFGPENLGLPSHVIQGLVQEALKMVAMEEFTDCATHLLSSDQKLRVTLAGILAMQPECILFDDAAAVLDPAGRIEFMTLLHDISREKKLTVIHATGNMEEVAAADRIIKLENGKIAFDGKPECLLSKLSNDFAVDN